MGRERVPSWLRANGNLILIVAVEFVVILLTVGRPAPTDYCANYREYQTLPERPHHPAGASPLMNVQR